jgi:hypothetical protein
VTGNVDTLTIVAVDSPAKVKDWLAVPYTVFAHDPAWVPPLDFMERRRISPRKAPFFTFGEVAPFVAYRGKQPVGRISAQVNRRHLDLYKDGVGHFGFFDCCSDPEVAQALIAKAAEWLRGRGLARMVGPMSFSLNDECGCLVSGFDTPPAILMTHARPWTGPLLEQSGLVKEMDLFAYRIIPTRLPQRVYDVAGLARQVRGLSIRQMDMRRYAEEVHTLVDIFNDAWSQNWGFVPFSPAEIDALLAEMRPLFRGEYGRFLMFNDEPVGVIVALPNINEVLARFHGKLLPFNWLKLLLALKRQRIRTARVPLLGIRKVYQSTPTAGMMLALLIAESIEAIGAYKIDWVEFSWVLETNKRMISLAEMAAGPPVKTYRLYGKTL